MLRQSVSRILLCAGAQLRRLLPALQLYVRFPPPPRYAGHSEQSAVTDATLVCCPFTSDARWYLPAFVALRKRIASAVGEDKLGVFPPGHRLLNDKRDFSDLCRELQHERDTRDKVCPLS